MPSPIPFLDLVTPHAELEAELVAAFRQALRSAVFVGGREVEGFEHEFASYCGVRHCVGVASGTDALRFALMAAGVGQGDAVVTVAHTFIATAEAITQAGAEPEFVDVDESACLMAPAAVEAYLAACANDPETGRPVGPRSRRPIRALVPVHLYGQLADMGKLLAIAERYGLLLVEDACQAHGAAYVTDGRSRRAGSIGVAGAFSFYPGKNLGACGEAGAVTTDDSEVARRIRMLRDHGRVGKYDHRLDGYNGRLDAIQAAVLRIKLRHLDAWNGARRTAAARYDSLFKDSAVTTLSEPVWSTGVYHLYVIRSPRRDELAEHLRREGIQTAIHYPIPVHLQRCYAALGYREGDLPSTERLAQEVLSLPMFPGIADDQQRRVSSSVLAFVGAGPSAEQRF